ncbi:unnamed protein product [Closterium sp. NIES-53]
MDCGVDLCTDPETRDILLHYIALNKARKQIRRAHSHNGVYILDFDIPDCSGDLQELIGLVPLRFEHIHCSDWKHPDGRPWVPHHLHPCKLALHDPDPDAICRDCHTPTASTSAIAGCGLVAIAEAERLAPPDEGMSPLEIEHATHHVFGPNNSPLADPPSQQLEGILRGRRCGTFDAKGRARPYTMEQGWGTSREDQSGGEEEETKPPVVPLGRPPRHPAPALPPLDVLPHGDPWDTIDWGNEPSTPRRTIYGPDPETREPTFVPGTIPGTNILLSAILNREFLALMLTTANDVEEEGADEAVAEPAPAHYMHTSGLRANDDLWHQRLGHPSRVTLKSCIEGGVFAPGALLRPDGTKVRGTSQPRNFTVCPETALSHQPFPLLEPGTNCYAKLEKVYDDFLVVGYCGTSDEQYTLTFIDAGTRYVWVVNLEARNKAYEAFCLWLAHVLR